MLATTDSLDGAETAGRLAPKRGRPKRRSQQKRKSLAEVDESGETDGDSKVCIGLHDIIHAICCSGCQSAALSACSHMLRITVTAFFTEQEAQRLTVEGVRLAFPQR